VDLRNRRLSSSSYDIRFDLDVQRTCDVQDAVWDEVSRLAYDGVPQIDSFETGNERAKASAASIVGLMTWSFVALISYVARML